MSDPIQQGAEKMLKYHEDRDERTQKEGNELSKQTRVNAFQITMRIVESIRIQYVIREAKEVLREIDGIPSEDRDRIAQERYNRMIDARTIVEEEGEYGD